MNLKPINDLILVQRVEDEDKSPGGIFLADSAKRKPKEGRVVAVGQGKVLPTGQRVEPQVAAGDRVIFGANVGEVVEHEGVEYLLMSQDAILAVVE